MQQLLLQDSPDILGILELHTSVLLRSAHTSASIKCKPTDTNNKNKLRGLSLRVNYTERPPLVGEVSVNFCR
jgi:hypothetical protein